MTSGSVGALNLSYFGAQQVAGLGTATIATMATSLFDQVVAPNVSVLSTLAVKGLTVAQIGSLSSSQASQFSTAQMSAMNSSQLAAVNGAYSVAKDAASLETNGALSFSGAMQVLQDAANGGMNATKFSGLQTLANQINTAGGPQMSAYVQQIFDDVVQGNAANAIWTGGSDASTKLGNLSAASSQTQASQLIAKWFGGTDNPGTMEAGADGVYQASTAPLFAAGGPKLTDVNQGEEGDCYFMAALAATAQQNPSLIKNMVTQNSNGTYGVEFWLNGKADYVTVDNQLATLTGGQHMGSGSNLKFDNGGSSGSNWSAIVEKAYVEFRSQTDGVNAFHDIYGGWNNGLAAITGQAATDTYVSASTSAKDATAILKSMQAALSSGNDVMMNTNNGNAADNLAESHMYAVTAVNVAAGTVTLDNPWNANGANTGMKMQFTESLAELMKNDVAFHVATGAAAAA
jgi:hypothetical protein